jgi:hypothetical protein
MAIPPTPQKPPSSVRLEYTVGMSSGFPQQTATVQAALSNILTANPSLLTVPWATYKQAAVTAPALAVNGTTTITATLGIPELTKYAVLPGRFLVFAVSGGCFHSINGLVMQSVQPQGLCTVGGIQVGTTGAKLGGGQTYTNFAAKITIVLYSVVATGGGTVTVWADALIVDSPQ